MLPLLRGRLAHAEGRSIERMSEHSRRSGPCGSGPSPWAGTPPAAGAPVGGPPGPAAPPGAALEPQNGD